MKQSTATLTPDNLSTDEGIFDAKDRLANFQGHDFRPGQKEAVKAILTSEKKVVAISAPTGTGKSLIGIITGMLHDRFCYLCSTKQLQRQIIDDFPEARYMVGRRNFACNQDKENRTADLCIHSTTTPCDLKLECFYELHKNAVLEHPYQILNYHYILNEANYIGKFSGYPVIVADEADVLESLLTSFTELKISFGKLYNIELSPPEYRTNTAKNWVDSCRTWAEDAQVKVNIRLNIVNDQIVEFSPNKKFAPGVALLVREFKSLKNLHGKLSMFMKHVDDTWIFQEITENKYVTGWKFQPTWLTPELSQQYFFRHADRFILMSATLPPKPILAHMLGLATEDIEFIELNSAFSAENRPVYLDPVADMSYRTFKDELPALLAEIQRLVDKHPNKKGIIHTVSYRLNKAVMELNNPRFITHDRYNKDEILRKFMESKNKVFVSPSSTRGVNLPDDLCRFIIIAKAPFQSLGDKLVSSRVHGTGGFGKFWYRAMCAQDIMQASGRGVRHKDDHCVTYVIDKQAEKIIVNNQGLFPRYWMEAVDYL